jgi:hypothetical protein
MKQITVNLSRKSTFLFGGSANISLPSFGVLIESGFSTVIWLISFLQKKYFIDGLVKKTRYFKR